MITWFSKRDVPKADGSIVVYLTKGSDVRWILNDKVQAYTIRPDQAPFSKEHWTTTVGVGLASARLVGYIGRMRHTCIHD